MGVKKKIEEKAGILWVWEIDTSHGSQISDDIQSASKPGPGGCVFFYLSASG